MTTRDLHRSGRLPSAGGWGAAAGPVEIVQSLWLADLLRAMADDARPPPAVAVPAAKFIFQLNGLQDLPITPAFFQVLSGAGAVNVSLLFGTEGAARLAARVLARFGGLVRIIPPAEIDEALAASGASPVVMLPARSGLGPRFGDWFDRFLKGRADIASIPLPPAAGSSIVVARSGDLFRGTAWGAVDIVGSDEARALAWLVDVSGQPVGRWGALIEEAGAGTRIAASLSAAGEVWAAGPGDAPDAPGKLTVGWQLASGEVKAACKVPGPLAGVTARLTLGTGAHAREIRCVTGIGPRGALDITARMPLDLVGSRSLAASLVVTSGGRIWRGSSRQLVYPPSQISTDMVTCYLNRGGAGNPMIRAFASGVGAPMRYAEDEAGSRPGVPVVWGVLRCSDKVIDFAARQGQYWFYIDHAYFSRGHLKNYRITRNRYEAGEIRACPPDRLRSLGLQPRPWNRDGSIILVCPPTAFFMAAHKCENWLEDTLAHLKRVTDRPVVVRVKPQPGETSEPLPEVLRRTHALVTHSSNVAVEAVVEGTPVFVSPTSAATPVGKTNLDEIDKPAYPDREAWLAHLAYSQFSFEEIGDGTAWRMLLEYEMRSIVSEGA